MSTATLSPGSSAFDRALTSVSALPAADQQALVEVVHRRLAAERRAELMREVALARRDHCAGKVRRGSAAELMAELRRPGHSSGAAASLGR